VSDPVEICVLGKKVRLLQPAGGFRTSLDSVMLAAACPAQKADRVLELGCGVGGAAFCLLHRLPDIFITGIDVQSEYIDLAQKNIGLNNGSDRCEFIKNDVRSFEVPMDARFDHVICNPPFLEAGTYMSATNEGRAIALAHTEKDLTLKDWVDGAFRNLKAGGSVTIIHRADMTDRILQALGKRFGAVEIIPLWPRLGEAAKRVIIRARKDRKTPATLHAGLILHNEDGAYTQEAEAVLREGTALFS